MEILQFKDTKTVPDIVHTYTQELRRNSVPIIIDNGSYMSRVGWATSSQPLLQFKNLIAKPRRERTKKDSVEIPQAPQLQFGNDIVNIEALRFQLKTQFDRNVVTHFEAQEQLFDYTFSHLGINTEGRVEHPILCTETVLNPNSSRTLMSELFFECYDVPSVCYGIDSIFAYHYYHNKEQLNNALIIDVGYQACHVIPVINNQVVFENIRRLNIGGYHIIAFLHRILQLKYPAHATAITLSRTEELLHTQCYVAQNYREQLVKWADHDYYEENVKKIQLPYSVNNVISATTLEQQKERKRELARRLTEINARKREERLAEDEDKLGQLLNVKEMVELGADRDEIETSLGEFHLKNVSDLEKTIVTLNAKIEKTRQKIYAAANMDEIEVVDAAPTPPKQMKTTPKMSFNTDKELQVFLHNIKKAKQEILTKKSLRRQRRQDMAKRRTAAGQERMRIISQLARKEKGNDDFGLRDEDWDIYKAISRDGGDSDSEAENEKLLEFDEILRTHEPNFSATSSAFPSSSTSTMSSGDGNVIDETLAHSVSCAETHQLHIGVELFRAPELIFKPYMFGASEAGLSEVVGYVLSLFPADCQLLLAENVILMGGLANVPGIRDRLFADLVSIRPFKSKVNVNVMEGSILGAWWGARNFARDHAEEFTDSSVTKEMYGECGGEYLREHRAGNRYFPTPPVVVTNDSIINVVQ